MSRSSNTLSRAELVLSTGKFCIPAPITISGTYSTTPKTAAVTSITRTGQVATVTTPAAHNLRTGDFTTISGAVQPEYNGRVKITALTLTTFSYYVTGSPTTPATGTILFGDDGCNAIGTGTFASGEFQKGDWLYDYTQGVARQVDNIIDNTHWSFSKNFPANVSSAAAVLAPRGVCRSVAIQNTGAAAGVVQGTDLDDSDGAISYVGEEGLEPIYGDATGTTFLISIEYKSDI